MLKLTPRVPTTGCPAVAIRSLILWAALALLLAASPVWGAEAYQVQVLPFRVHAAAAAPDLARQVAENLAGPLSAAGAQVTVPVMSETEVRRLMDGGAVDLGAYGRTRELDYVVWGSATRIGGHFSIDARLLDVGAGRSETFFLDGQRAERLATALRDLGRDMAARIYKQYKVAAIRVEGNERIEADAIERVVRTKPGDLSNPKQLAADLKAVFAMGYFEDVRVETRESATGPEVVFIVREKPTVRVIRISGNRTFDDKEIKEAMTLRTGSILNEARLRNNVERIETLYTDKNYHNVKVNYEIHPLENNQADIAFDIEEGDKIRIQRIVFQGNEAVSDKDLKKVMKTSEAWFLSWLTSDGELNQEALNQDIGQIKAYYHNRGYIQARVGDPQIDFQPDGIEITIKVDEGPRYTVGEVTVGGELVQPADQLLERLNIRKEEYFSREVVRNDVLMLTDIYSDEGYAYAEIQPDIDRHEGTRTVDIAFKVTKGPLVHFEKIIISGNTKTRDKVIRRQLEVYEQELYKGAKLKKGVRNLFRLEYFEDVKVDTAKGSTEDSMVLKVDVKEKPTGAFTFGGGYSTIENVFMVFSVSQRNLFGRGQILNLSAQLGGATSKYSISFTEPWLFDIPLAATVDVYNWETDYDTYDKDSIGGGLRLSYPFWEYTRVYWGYRLDVSDVTAVTVDAADSVKQMEGSHTTSSTEVAVRYDSRDRLFSPTKGLLNGVSVEFAGLGGDVGFVKTEAESGYYFPLLWKLVGYLHAKAGYVEESDGKLLPDYEKFYLGGINSLRGFRWRDLAPTEVNSDGYTTYVGGEKYMQFNAEVLIPIEEKMGFMAVFFFDTGEVYSQYEKIEFDQFRESAGAGIRWYSPLGPIRIEYGHILDPKPGFGEGGRWEFTMGSTF